MPVARPARQPASNVRWIVSSPIGPTGAAIDRPISSDWKKRSQEIDICMPALWQGASGPGEGSSYHRIQRADPGFVARRPPQRRILVLQLVRRHRSPEQEALDLVAA